MEPPSGTAAPRADCQSGSVKYMPRRAKLALVYVKAM
jgi:hypothetical protein